MSGTVSVLRSDTEIIISITGQFVFDLHRPFRAAYLHGEHTQKIRFIIDMSHVEYLDSAAIGMLLMMREETGAEDRAIIINNNARGQVGRVLSATKMERFFQIRENVAARAMISVPNAIAIGAHGA
ncbi:MAG: STAS domain-containing protein [Magnetococcus sp. DMHC-8]